MSAPRLEIVGSDQEYSDPVKRIYDGADVQCFLHSKAYRDITTFILQLNRALVPRKDIEAQITEYRLHPDTSVSPSIHKVGRVLAGLKALVSEAPPDTGPRRFGNVSFRKWHGLASERVPELLGDALPLSLQAAVMELKTYLLGSFGSPQRLDYGTGHELSFVAFLACLWKLDYFDIKEGLIDHVKQSDMSSVEREIILHLFASYLDLVRELIVTYNLEPAGSHGVWGLDDNSFLPYLFGSAQLNQPLPSDETSPPTPTPVSGSLPSAPEPSIVTNSNLVDKEATSNLYFGAIKFIYTVKRGPFWEHSPILFDISGIKDGWGKINKGLIKMYDAEVLSKFPVVQHFPFGSLLKWERDPAAMSAPTTTSSQLLREPGVNITSHSATGRAPSSTRPHQTTPMGFVNGATQAPWAKAGTISTTNSSFTRLPLHSQASQPAVHGNRPSNTFAPRLGNPGSAATRAQLDLARKTAEPIREAQEGEEVSTQQV